MKSREVLGYGSQPRKDSEGMRERGKNEGSRGEKRGEEGIGRERWRGKGERRERRDRVGEEGRGGEKDWQVNKQV